MPRAQTRTPESQKGVSATMDRRTFATLAGAAAAAIALPGCASEKRDLSETAAPETKDSIAAAQQEELELFPGDERLQLLLLHHPGLQA